MSDLTKPNQTSSISLNKGKLRSSSSPFQQRVNQAKLEEVDPNTMPNRICLMLDRSSSMSTPEKRDRKRIDLLKEALVNFVSRCNLTDTSIAIETFPKCLSLPLTSYSNTLQTSVFAFDSGGDTPMRRCVESCLENVPMTRGVIVSDGQATDWRGSLGFDDDDDSHYTGANPSDSLLAKYKEARIPIDCVHISNDVSGEELLRKIARETGGIFIKFTDVSAFSNAFGYLAPSMRGLLSDGRVDAKDIGAKELR